MEGDLVSNHLIPGTPPVGKHLCSNNLVSNKSIITDIHEGKMLPSPLITVCGLPTAPIL